MPPGIKIKTGCPVNFTGYINEKGIALFIVLWVLTILMAVVLSFSAMTRTETHATMAFKEGAEKKFLAEAGINRGIMELFYRKQNQASSGSEVWKTDGTSYSNQMGDGYYTVKITDESGKVDINKASELILKNLFTNTGLQEEIVNTIVDSIMDWKDADDLRRLNGAESDYYMSLPNPYKAKNADFDTVEELMLVKGITPEILYGNGEHKGVIDFLTVKANSNTVNINAAPREVLMAVPGVTSEIADSILSYRVTKDIQNIQEVPGISGGVAAMMSPYVRTNGANTFTIESNGYKGNKTGGYAIRATVNILGNNKYNFIYYKSPVAPDVPKQ